MALAGLWISRLIRDPTTSSSPAANSRPSSLCATITATNLSMFHFISMGGTAYRAAFSIIWQNWTGDMTMVVSADPRRAALCAACAIRSVPELLELTNTRPLRTLIARVLGICGSACYLGLHPLRRGLHRRDHHRDQARR